MQLAIMNFLIVSSMDAKMQDMGASTLELVQVGEIHALSNNKTVRYECEECGRKVGANRFPRHLAACLGMGRTSSRLAHCRTAANKGRGKSIPKTTRTKVSKNDTRRVPVKGIENISQFEGTSHKQRKIILANMCAVVNPRTYKFCRNTFKCRKHSRDEKVEVRYILSKVTKRDLPSEEIRGTGLHVCCLNRHNIL